MFKVNAIFSEFRWIVQLRFIAGSWGDPWWLPLKIQIRTSVEHSSKFCPIHHPCEILLVKMHSLVSAFHEVNVSDARTGRSELAKKKLLTLKRSRGQIGKILRNFFTSITAAALSISKFPYPLMVASLKAIHPFGLSPYPWDIGVCQLVDDEVFISNPAGDIYV